MTGGGDEVQNIAIWTLSHIVIANEVKQSRKTLAGFKDPIPAYAGMTTDSSATGGAVHL